MFRTSIPVAPVSQKTASPRSPIIAQRPVETDFADTAKDLHRRLEEVQFDLFTNA